MIRYTLTIFLSAFLLFLVQPLAARLILPRYGGSAAVWTTCMMYFQIALLIGYVYSHAIRSLVGPRTGWILHCGMLFLAWVCVNLQSLSGNSFAVTPALSALWPWSVLGMGELELPVTFRLTTAIGIPVLVLSATSPLIQAWHSASHRGRDTYRLYAVSNAGCMAALILFPIFFDAFLPLSVQTAVWSGSFAMFCLLMALCGLQIWQFPAWPDQIHSSGSVQPAGLVAKRCWESLRLFGLWTLLAAIASCLLLSATNILCQEVASWPFLWVLPLVCYLLGLILCFDRPQWYRRRIFYPALVISIFLWVVLFHLGTGAGLVNQMLGGAALVFCGSMACHGELVRIKPEPARLTRFYLAIALGGAVGSVFAVAVAHRIFDQFIEAHISLMACLIVCSALVWSEFFGEMKLSTNMATAHLLLTLSAATPIVCSLAFETDARRQSPTVFRHRNEYGMVSVKDVDGYRYMFNGQTNHGGQYLDERAALPSAYYSTGSGADRAFSMIRQRRSNRLNVGVIGLGSGSLASHGQHGDRFRFYEINPLVVLAAKRHFSYLKNSKSAVIVGDGRIQLANELGAMGSHRFDLLFIDAFSSDSIPVHLLTSESFDLYLKHLSVEGLIVAHITNQFVDLQPILRAMAIDKKLGFEVIRHENRDFRIKTKWVLMSPSRDMFDGATDRQPDTVPPASTAAAPVWTDDFSSLAPAIRWHGDNQQ